MREYEKNINPQWAKFPPPPWRHADEWRATHRSVAGRGSARKPLGTAGDRYCHWPSRSRCGRVSPGSVPPQEWSPSSAACWACRVVLPPASGGRMVASYAGSSGRPEAHHNASFREYSRIIFSGNSNATTQKSSLTQKTKGYRFTLFCLRIVRITEILRKPTEINLLLRFYLPAVIGYGFYFL